MTTNDEGKTQAPSHQTDTKPECMERWKHSWEWVWENGQMTDKVKCSTCGTVREMNISERE